MSPGKPWEGMDWQDEGTTEWVEGLTDVEYREWQDWRAQSEREADERWRRENDPTSQQAPQMSDEDFERYKASHGGAPSGPQIAILDHQGSVMTRVVDDEPFVVSVSVPRAQGQPAPDTIEVTFKAPDGSTDSLTLTNTRNVGGPAVYRSNPQTPKRGGEGGATATVQFLDAIPTDLTGDLQFNYGGFGGFNLDDGDILEVTYGDLTTSTRVFTSGARLGLDAVSQAIGQADGFYRTLLVNLLGAIRQVESAPASEEKTEMLGILSAMRTDADIRLGLATRARLMLNNTAIFDHQRLAAANLYATYLGLYRGAARDGTLPPLPLLARWDLLDENYSITSAMNKAKEDVQGIFWHGIGQATIAGYRLLAHSTGVAQLMTLGGMNEMGQRTTGWDKFFAAVDLIVQGSMMGAMVKFNLNTAIPTRDLSSGLPTTQPRLDRPGGRLADTAPGTTKPLVGARSGQVVQRSRDVGLTEEQGKTFNLVIDQKIVQWGRPIRAMQRPASTTAVDRIAEGAAGKPEPIKSKGINDTDIEGGWAQRGTQDTPAYFNPQQLSDATGQPIARFADPTPPAGMNAKVWDRARQRMQEFHDEKPMMDDILGRGLAKVDPNGQIIDHGISNYRLDPDTHQLVEAGWGGNARGTGKPMASDPDPYEFQWQDPSTGKWSRIPDAQEAELTNALHAAGVMHGPVAHWNPLELKNLGIKGKIMGAHDAFSVDKDGMLVVNPDAEALVVFGGRFSPRITTYGDIGVAPLNPGGLSRGARAVTGIDDLTVPGFQPWFTSASTQELLDGTAPNGPGWEWTQQYDWQKELEQWRSDAASLDEVFDPVSETWVEPPRARSRTKMFAIAGSALVALGLGAALLLQGGGADQVAKPAAPSASVPQQSAPPASQPPAVAPVAIESGAYIGTFGGVAGRCPGARNFGDRFNVTVNGRKVTTTQPSTRDVMTGTVAPNGSLILTGPGERFVGSIARNLIRGTYSYRSGTCTELWRNVVFKPV